MAEILHQLIGSLSYCLQGAGFQPSTVGIYQVKNRYLATLWKVHRQVHQLLVGALAVLTLGRDLQDVVVVVVCTRQGQCLGSTPPKFNGWNLQMMVSNKNLLFQGSIFRFHVCFGGCKYFGVCVCICIYIYIYIY